MKHNLYAYVGTYTSSDSKGIYSLKLNSEDSSLESLNLAANLNNPSYIIADRAKNYLYSVMEVQNYNDTSGGAIAAFSIDKSNGCLTFLNSKPTYGKDPCHITITSDNRYIIAANYSSGSFTVFPISNDGSIGDSIQVIEHSGSGPNKNRQEMAHVHFTAFTPDEKYLCVIDLGADKIFVYDFNIEDGSLKYNDSLSLDIKAGSGPRHMVFHPKYNFIYVINELSSEVTVLKYELSSFKLKKLQTLSTLPQGSNCENLCAAIHISPDGNFLYASNRGHNSIAVFKIEKNIGTLECISIVSTNGDFPRDFAITPDGNFLYAANQNSDSITIFNVDNKTGLLNRKLDTLSISCPVCIKIYDFDV